MKTDKSEAHLEYQIRAQKPVGDVSPSGLPCLDGCSIKVHNKADAEKIVEFLRKLGFKVKMCLDTSRTLVDDPYPWEQ